MRLDPAGETALLASYGITGARLPDHPPSLPLWLVTVAQAPHPAAIGLLPTSEAEKAGRFRSPALRDRYVAGHAALRLLAEHGFGVPVARQHWVANAWGKPALADVPDAQCSLSYTTDHALLGWSEGEEIGIDIEAARSIEDAWDLAELHYTPGERALLAEARCSPGAFDRTFLSIWTRKEACLKAVGRGLDIPPSTFECLSDPAIAVPVGDRMVCTGIVPSCDGLLVAWARCS